VKEQASLRKDQAKLVTQSHSLKVAWLPVTYRQIQIHVNLAKHVKVVVDTR